MTKPAPVVHLPCCGVYAVFLAPPDPEFNPVFARAKSLLKRSDKWQGRMMTRELADLLRSFGVQFARYRDPLKLTIGRAFKDCLFAKDSQYVLAVAGHFLTIRNGLCYDQSNPDGVPVADYRYKRSKIKSCLHII